MLTELQELAVEAIGKRVGVIIQAKPGSGKTRVVLEAIARERVTHVIYCSTPQIAYAGLPEEVQKAGYDIDVHSFEDQDRRGETLRRWQIHGGILTVSIQSLHKLPIVKIPCNATWFVLDESTLAKRPGGIWAETAQQVANACSKRILLTGTVRSNELHHLYKQAAIAIGDYQEVVARLGRFETWKRRHFFIKPVKHGHVRLEKLVPKPGAEKHAAEELSDIIVALDDLKSAQKSPKVVERIVEVGPVDMPYTYYLYGRPGEPVEKTYTFLQQTAFGVFYTPARDGERKRRTQRVHNEKLDAIKDLLTRHRRAIYVYTFDYEREIVTKMVKSLGLKPAHATARRKTWIDKWNSGKIDVLLLHPRAAGHGLNLQFGGNVMIFGVPTPDYEAYTQTVARLARHGQAESDVLVYEIVCKGTIDEVARKARTTRQSKEKALLDMWRRAAHTNGENETKEVPT